MTNRPKIIAGFLVLSLLAFLPALGFQVRPDMTPEPAPKKKVVYVVPALRGNPARA